MEESQSKWFATYSRAIRALGATILLIFLCINTSIAQEKHTISGYVEDAESGERLIQSNVFDINSETGTVTNTFGFFSLTLEEGPVKLAISYVGYQKQFIDFDLRRDTVLNIMVSSSVALAEVKVVADSVRRIEEETQMSVVEIPISQIKKIPALLGEVDVLKAMQLLPGVQSGGEGQSGLYVRGGSPDQNLILLDGVPVYNASHLFGFFSVFNADAIKDVKLIKGGFPARYGGRLSSVIDINMKDGNKKDYHGNVSIGLISSKVTLEGPLVKDKTTFLVSARRTYIDILTRPFVKQSFKSVGSEGNAGYYFYDLNGKVTHKISDRDRLFFSVYNGKDKFYFEEKETEGEFKDNVATDLGWGNTILASRWNHVWNPKMFSNTTVTYSRYGLGTLASFETVSDDSNSKNELEYTSGIRDFAGKIDFDYIPNSDHFVKFGASSIYHQFIPGSFDLFSRNEDDNSSFLIDTTIGQRDEFGMEYAIYAEDDYAVTDDFKINGGIHFSAFNVDGKTYTSLQPRLSMCYLLPNKMAIKASYSEMQQYVHLLAFDGIGLPTDLWLPTTDRIKPQFSRQVALGLAKTFKGTYEISVEGYYKTMENVIAYKEGAGLFQLNDWQDRVTQGDGKSYGAEIFVQKKLGRLTGWIGYTLAWATRQFDDLNRGEEYPFKYDRRHDLSIVASYDITDRIRVSGTWVYGTGNAVTLSNTEYHSVVPGIGGFFGTTPVSYNKNKNKFLMRDYHPMDYGIDFLKEKDGYTRKWSFGAYNSYNRKNPFFIYYDEEFTNSSGDTETVLKQASLFPIIPYVTWGLDF